MIIKDLSEGKYLQEGWRRFLCQGLLKKYSRSTKSGPVERRINNLQRSGHAEEECFINLPADGIIASSSVLDQNSTCRRPAYRREPLPVAGGFAALSVLNLLRNRETRLSLDRSDRVPGVTGRAGAFEQSFSF